MNIVFVSSLWEKQLGGYFKNKVMTGAIKVNFDWTENLKLTAVLKSVSRGTKSDTAGQSCSVNKPERHQVGGNACLSFLVRWRFVCSHLVPLVTRPSHVWASCACWGFPSGWTYWCSKGTWRAYYQRGGACGPAGCTFCWKTSHKPEWTIREIRSGILVRLI